MIYAYETDEGYFGDYIIKMSDMIASFDSNTNSFDMGGKNANSYNMVWVYEAHTYIKEETIANLCPQCSNIIGYTDELYHVYTED